MLGSLGARIKQYHGIAIVNRLVEKLGGEGVYLNAPFLVENADLAKVLMESKDIVETMQLADQADLALLGIGSAEPQDSAYFLAGYLMNRNCKIFTILERSVIFAGCFSISTVTQFTPSFRTG